MRRPATRNGAISGSELEEAAYRASRHAQAHLVQLLVELPEAGQGIDDAERQDNRRLDEEDRRRRYLEPYDAENGPADGREAAKEDE